MRFSFETSFIEGSRSLRSLDQVPVRGRRVEARGAQIHHDGVVRGRNLFADSRRAAWLELCNLLLDQRREAAQLGQWAMNRVNIHARLWPCHDLEKHVWSIVFMLRLQLVPGVSCVGAQQLR